MCGAPIRDRHHEPIVTAWTLFAFALVCVIARFFARSNRLFNGPGYGWDDWFVLIDMPILLAGNTMTHISTVFTVFPCRSEYKILMLTIC